MKTSPPPSRSLVTKPQASTFKEWPKKDATPKVAFKDNSKPKVEEKGHDGKMEVLGRSILRMVGVDLPCAVNSAMREIEQQLGVVSRQLGPDLVKLFSNCFCFQFKCARLDLLQECLELKKEERFRTTNWGLIQAID
ncbi:hypothetical protein M9H77_30267 [Catharanthus roseus]|uniref:Uncharacterized protein n=1 Tax=Catharanthus roseus TaxID=4058 RepID=A0ACB9ZWS4_CATRO|nr:hypothetical protein M9H77_30267 [Catharanthus roseus]